MMSKTQFIEKNSHENVILNQKLHQSTHEKKSLMSPQTLTHCLYMIWSPYRRETYIVMTIRSEVQGWTEHCSCSFLVDYFWS